MIFYNSKGKPIGELTEKGNFKKSVDSRIHRMRNFNAYGIDEDVIKKLEGKCNLIVVRERDTGTMFKVPYMTFVSKGFIKKYDGEQRFLALKWWDRYEEGNWIARDKEKTDLQPKLL